MYAEYTSYDNVDEFIKLDYNLRNLSKQTFVFRSSLIDSLPSHEPGISTLGGGRHIGKTTLLKQWMLHLMQSGVNPHNIMFFTGEIIDDHHRLINILNTNISNLIYIYTFINLNLATVWKLLPSPAAIF